jgi:hypothetical protein
MSSALTRGLRSSWASRPRIRRQAASRPSSTPSHRRPVAVPVDLDEVAPKYRVPGGRRQRHRQTRRGPIRDHRILCLTRRPPLEEQCNGVRARFVHALGDSRGDREADAALRTVRDEVGNACPTRRQRDVLVSRPRRTRCTSRRSPGQQLRDPHVVQSVRAREARVCTHRHGVAPRLHHHRRRRCGATAAAWAADAARDRSVRHGGLLKDVVGRFGTFVEAAGRCRDRRRRRSDHNGRTRHRSRGSAGD